MTQLFVPFIKHESDIPRFLRHPIYQLFRLRGIIADHSQSEEELLQKYARGRKILVEIGVAEGASALALRQVTDSEGTLFLVDPYLPGRIPKLNITKLVAHRHVSSCCNAKVHWIEDFSYNAAKTWYIPIDFLFIDGDHSYDACLRDWIDWSPFVAEGGIVAFHDARIFKQGWTNTDWGSVRVVDKLFRCNQNSAWQIIDEVDSLVIVQKSKSHIGQ